MRRGIACFLLPLLLYQTALLLPLTQLSLELHQKEVKERLLSEKEKEGKEVEELMKLSFSEREFRTELEWKEEREFVYGGEMYDLVDAERKGDRIVLTVYKDERETKMKERYRTLREGSAGQDGKENDGSFESVQPFKYFKKEGVKLLAPFGYRELYPAFPPKQVGKVHLGVPLPPPCSKRS